MTKITELQVTKAVCFKSLKGQSLENLQPNMFGKVKVSVYHGFQSDKAVLLMSADLELNDTVSCISGMIGNLHFVPVDLILLFHGNVTESPLCGDTKISELASSPSQEIELYFGLKRCKQSLEMVRQKTSRNLKNYRIL